MVDCFRQKPAYEVRISDWSSDVCSSDLGALSSVLSSTYTRSTKRPSRMMSVSASTPQRSSAQAAWRDRPGMWCPSSISRSPAPQGACAQRSEEHTSELQSLMRISYAVFCLNKKKIQNMQAHTADSNRT